ncbi:MAG: hypothetical protein ACFB9M_09535 [Myxococcota bacterium]
MSIDWVTVSAQTVNFVILLLLLRRFLYRPVLDAMAARETEIAEQFQEADARNEASRREAERLASEREDLAENRETLLTEARLEADRAKKEMMASARQEVEILRAGYRAQTEREREAFLDSLKQETASLFVSIIRRILRDLASQDLEHHVVRTFVGRLPEGHGLEFDGQIRIASSFPLNDASRSLLDRCIREACALDASIEFSEDPGLVCGIEISDGRRQLGWNFDQYLRELKEAVDVTLSQSRGVTAEDDGFAREPAP